MSLFHETTALQWQIDAKDRQIDKLVYELYGLTEEEIRTVEGREADSLTCYNSQREDRS